MNIFSNEYLQSPTEADLARLLKIGEKRGFPGMLGSLDCMHWTWKNCPTAHGGQYSGKEKGPTIILEAVASYDTWIWHAFFGLPGTLNDLNVLDRSPLFKNIQDGIAPSVKFSVNSNKYTMPYFLSDSIYQKWATLIQTITFPNGKKEKNFAKHQEAARKDVERAFGILQARWSIIKQPSRLWDQRELHYIMKACIIMHNMIVEDERDSIFQNDFNYDQVNPPDTNNASGSSTEFHFFLQRYQAIRNQNLHSQLKTDLIEHQWKLHEKRLRMKAQENQGGEDGADVDFQAQ